MMQTVKPSLHLNISTVSAPDYFNTDDFPI